MAKETTADNFTCYARRHMDAEFRAYDFIVAVVQAARAAAQEKGEWKPGDALPTFYGKEHTIANAIDRSVEQVRVALGKLEESGWIVPTHDTARRRKRAGNYTTNEWRVLTHDEYMAAYPDRCPALRYDPETGRKLQPGELPPGLARANLRRIPDEAGFMATLPDCLLDMVITGSPRKTITGNPVQAETAITGNPVTAITGNPAAASTGNPVPADTGNPVTSLKVEAGEREAGMISPARHDSENGRAGRQAAPPSHTSSNQNQNPPSWRIFINSLDSDEMKYAKPTADEQRAIMQQLEECGPEALACAVDEWVEYQSPPLHTLQYGRWKRWLETGDAIFENWNESFSAKEWRKQQAETAQGR